MTYRIYTYAKTNYQTDDCDETLRQFWRPIVVNGENALKAKVKELESNGFAIAEICTIFGQRVTL